VELVRADSPEAAVAGLGNGSLALAGGTDLVPLLRERLIEASTLVDIRRAVPRGIEDGRIGAGTTLGELEADPQVPDALREACRLSASPQLRASGTIGGNLLQATRCWYWRLAFPCRLHGGDKCHARDGEHREHAIFANDFCASAHPSDPAAALLALNARPHPTRLPLGDLYRLLTRPTAADDRPPDELILGWRSRPDSSATPGGDGPGALGVRSSASPPHDRHGDARRTAGVRAGPVALPLDDARRCRETSTGIARTLVSARDKRSPSRAPPFSVMASCFLLRARSRGTAAAAAKPRRRPRLHTSGCSPSAGTSIRTAGIPAGS
jgi:hypothetical protein